MKCALVGNQNSGKSLLFNDLTGLNQKVGNWAGVTIERKEGIIKGTDIEIVDLPGIYSLSPYTSEEEVSRKFIIEEKPDLIINIIDSTSIERSLYLTTQLLELGIDVVIVLNMEDILKKRGYKLDIKQLENYLHTSCYSISALKNTGIKELVNAIKNKEYKENSNLNIFNSDMSNLLKKLEKFCNKGINFDSVCNKLQVFIRDILIYKNTKNYFDSEYESRLDKYCNFKDDIYIKLCQELFSLSNELKKTSSQKMLVEIYFIKMVLLLSNNDNTTNINNNNNAILNDNSTQLKVADEQNYIKKIRINNALSGANKEFKNKFVDKFKIIDEYTSSKKYNSLASILKKANVEVDSDKNIIFSFKNSFETVLFDKNNLEMDEFISKIFNREYKTTSVTLEEWNEIKNNYIKNVNNGIKYEYIDEQKQKNKKNNNSELDNTLSNIFGEKYKIID